MLEMGIGFEKQAWLLNRLISRLLAFTRPSQRDIWNEKEHKDKKFKQSHPAVVDYFELTVGDFFKHAAVDIVDQPTCDQEKQKPDYQHHKPKDKTPQQHAF